MGRKPASQLTKEIDAIKALSAWANEQGQRVAQITVGSVSLTLVPEFRGINVAPSEGEQSIFAQYGGGLVADYLNREGGE